jgi:hypothetical protein
MFAFPSLYLLNEVIDQPVNVHEGVGLFLVAKVLVIALAAFVVEADHPPAGLHINEAVLETVARRRTGSGTRQTTISRPVPSSAMSRKRVISSAFMLATMPTAPYVVNVANRQRGEREISSMRYLSRQSLPPAGETSTYSPPVSLSLNGFGRLGAADRAIG